MTSPQAIIGRLLSAVRTGKPITALWLDDLGLLSRHQCWPQAMQAIGDRADVHARSTETIIRSKSPAPSRRNRTVRSAR